MFVELGSGTGFIGEEMAKKGWFFIGIDFSQASLKYLYKRLIKNGIKNFLLIHADIQKIPLADNSVDLIFGGGVIEHFKNTQVVLNHLYRVLKKGGAVYNGAPHLNIANIVYRSQWGGIPNFPVLKQLAEFINIKLLKSKHMVFGYELQFSKGQLFKMHLNSGFTKNNIIVRKCRTPIELNIIKNKQLRKFLINICQKYETLWPAVEVVAIK